MLTNNLSRNLNLIKEEMKHNATLKIRHLRTKSPALIPFAVLFCDGLISIDYVSESIIRKIADAPLITKNNCFKILEEHYIDSTEIRYCNTVKETVLALCSGDAVILTNDKSAMVVSAKGYPWRATTEPEGEGVSIGSHEGFTEVLLHNVARLSRRLKSKDFKCEPIYLGVSAPTGAYICYMEKRVNKKALRLLRLRLKKMDADHIINANALSERIKDHPYSLFSTIAKTERPDVAAAKLMEGRIVILIDGSAAALTLPTVFMELFQTANDYYVNFWYASASRFLRTVSFVLTISVPSVYIAILCFHRQLLPTNLLISIASAREGVPFPIILETVILLLAFDILRDASTHISPSMGQSLSIVGALILGDAAVSARLISAPLVIVAALTGLTGLANVQIRSATLIWRYLLLILGAMAGLYGYIFGMLIFCLALARKKSFSVPYSQGIFPLSFKEIRDSFIRFPWNKLSYKNIFGGGNEKD